VRKMTRTKKGASACAAAYSASNCVGHMQGTHVSSGGHNWVCANANGENCATAASCVPGAAGCPWGAVWTDAGPCR
jgi:hypothetical protein